MPEVSPSQETKGSADRGGGLGPLPRFAVPAPRALVDRLFPGLSAGVALVVPCLILLIAFRLLHASSLALKAFGLSFLWGRVWDPVREIFGSAPFIFGTLASSALALLIAAPLGLAIALFLTEFSPARISGVISFLVEMLAAIPSVVYGLWGIFLLAPFMREYVDPHLAGVLGKPFFVLPSMGLSLLTAGVMLAIMILPTICSISREIFLTVPRSFRESALALGATRWEAIQMTVLPPSVPGVLGALMLGLGRALGETMAVTMVIGNRPEISANLLAPSHSMSSVIANEFTEAVSDTHLAALAEIGFLLLVITLVLNMAAQILVRLVSMRHRRFGGRA